MASWVLVSLVLMAGVVQGVHTSRPLPQALMQMRTEAQNELQTEMTHGVCESHDAYARVCIGYNLIVTNPCALQSYLWSEIVPMHARAVVPACLARVCALPILVVMIAPWVCE